MRDYEKDIKKIRTIAEQYHCGIHTAAKSFYEYEKGTQFMCCRRCANLLTPKYQRGEVRQCEIIGVSGNRTADLDLSCVCKQFTKK